MRLRSLLVCAAVAIAVLAGLVPAAQSRGTRLATGPVLASGTWAVTVHNGGTVYRSTWTVKVGKTGKIAGSSKWDCCPGARTDPLSGSTKGYRVTIDRDCSLQGQTACVRQTFTGTITRTGATSGVLRGSWVGPGVLGGETYMNVRLNPPSPDRPELTLAATATRINRQSGGTLSIKATIRTPAGTALRNAKLRVRVSPAVNLEDRLAAGASVAVGDVPEDSTHTTALKPVALAPVVVADGDTIPGMNTWTKNGWSTDKAVSTLGGGDLVYSDSPEFLATSTGTRGGPAGVNGEGVLYAQRGRTTSGTRRPDFRVYLNHENRTTREKALCLVFTSPTHSVVTITRGPEGLARRFANPVAAGKEALIDYEQSRRAGTGRGSLTVPADGAAARCVTTIGHKGTYAEVANGIFDFTADGAVQVGVVAVNAGRAPGFERNPLGFHFIDEAHPQGNPKRTYATDARLRNAGETHVSGTFPYDEVDVKLPRFKPESGTRIGVRLAGKPHDEPHEYTPAIDTKQINLGNYGVFYNVSVDVGGTAKQSAQLLLNPRAVGRNEEAHVTNGYAGVADVPATTAGRSPSGPPIGTPAGDKNLTDADLGIGIGRAAGASTFTFSFMPPGGASLPVAVVASPAFVTVEATLTYSGGSVEAEPVTIVLHP